MLRSLTLIFALALAPFAAGTLSGCGPKEDSSTGYMNEDGTVNPRNAFLMGVTKLKTPDRKSGEIDYAGAYELFNAAVGAKPDYAPAQYNAGWTAEKLGWYDKAEAHYREAYNAEQGNSEYMFAYADVLTRNKRGAEAVSLYEKYLASNPNDLKVRNSLMEALTAAGQYDRAIAEAKEILIQDANNVGAYRNLSRIYFAQGNYAMSQLCAEKAKTLAEGDAGIYNNIGVTYLVMENEQAAIAEFQTARQLNPGHLEANLNLGFIALNSGDYALAKECFEKAVAAEPGNLDAKLGLAVALRGTREYEEADKLYGEIIKADPSNQLAYFNASRLHAKYTKDYKKAGEYLDRYIEANNASGQIGPSHEVFNRKKEVDELRRIEEERIAAEKRKAQEAEERKKRQQEQFELLKTKYATLKADLDKYASCEAMIESGGIEMGMMIAEQVQPIIDAEEIDMAGDVMPFLDDLQPQLDAIKPMCEGAAPAPEGSGGEAPAPTEAPAETPAEGTPAETPAEP